MLLLSMSIYGITVNVWYYCQCMVLLSMSMYGITVNVWYYCQCQCMVLLSVYGITVNVNVWYYCQCMVLLSMYGITVNVLHYCRCMLVQIYYQSMIIVNNQICIKGWNHGIITNVFSPFSSPAPSPGKLLEPRLKPLLIHPSIGCVRVCFIDSPLYRLSEGRLY